MRWMLFINNIQVGGLERKEIEEGRFSFIGLMKGHLVKEPTRNKNQSVKSVLGRFNKLEQGIWESM